MQPGVTHKAFQPAGDPFKNNLVVPEIKDPNQMRWNPMTPVVEGDHTFVEGLVTFAGAGGPATRSGIRIYHYTANKSMVNESFYNADGDFLIVPQDGDLDIQTELGFLEVRPGEICVVPRGMNFAVGVEKLSRGYICEVYGHFTLPDLGPIGANGLATPRDFLTPVACPDKPTQEKIKFRMYNKFMEEMFVAEMDHSVFNVVAWWGNYVPFKYDLDRFNTMNSVSFDDPDPSIFTVITCPTNEPGVAACDLAIFPKRWMCAEGTFRPPYYHRNCMAEFMGLIRGAYDAKVGFRPGGSTLHNFMTPHGPDAATHKKASEEELKPVRYPDTMAFMFETSFMLSLTPRAAGDALREMTYQDCWTGLENHFAKES
jgi:homogentisate 1,2-dioxygenase